MDVKFSDPQALAIRFEDEIADSFKRVLKSGQYILGPELEALETEFASYIGSSFAIGVANGTDALALALRALGVSSGDEVITVSMTAVATVAAIEMVGARPVLVDVQRDYYTMDPASLESAITSRTRAVIPVHLYGHPVELSKIGEICRRHGIHVVEDCSQAHGAVVDGKRVGNVGVIGAFSCYPTKNLGALGDAGLLTTSDADIAIRLRALRQYGWRERNWSLEPGVNSRLDEFQAAILRVKLRHLDRLNAERSSIADTYSTNLAALPVELPQVRSDSVHAWHLYTVSSESRDSMREFLNAKGVATGVYYPHPVHLQPAYNGRLSPEGSLPVTERLSKNVMSLPLYPGLSSEEISISIAYLHEFFAV